AGQFGVGVDVPADPDQFRVEGAQQRPDQNAGGIIVGRARRAPVSQQQTRHSASRSRSVEHALFTGSLTLSKSLCATLIQTSASRVANVSRAPGAFVRFPDETDRLSRSSRLTQSQQRSDVSALTACNCQDQKRSVGRYNPQTARKVSHTSPTVARARSASFIGLSTFALPSAAARRALSADST